MGKINVVLADGTTVSVDEETYKASKGQAGAARVESVEAGVARSREERKAAVFEGAGWGAAAGLISAADTVSFGTVGKVAQLIDPDAKEAQTQLAEAKPLATGLGALAGAVAPVGMAAGAAKIGGAVAARAGGAGIGARAAGLTAEGVVQGVAAEMTAANISTEPMTIEGLASTVGISAALNVGIGLVAHRLINGGSGKALKALDPGELKVGEGLDWAPGAVKNKTPLGDLAKARAKADAALEATKKAEDIEELLSTAREKAKDVAKAATSSARSEARAAAEQAFVDATIAREKALDAQGVMKNELKAARDTLDNSPAYENLRASYENSQKAARANNAQVAKDAAAWQAFSSEKGVTSILGEYDRLAAEARSQLQKVRAQGPEAGVKKALATEARAKAQVLSEAAIEAEGSKAALLDAQANVQTAKAGASVASSGRALEEWEPVLTELKAINKEVRSAIRAGDMDSAVMSIQATNKRLAAHPTLRLKLPELPVPPGELMPEGPQLPKRLLGLGAKRPESIAAIANALDDLSMAELNKLADELGLVPDVTSRIGITEPMSPQQAAPHTISLIAKALRDDYYVPLQKLESAKLPKAPRRGAITEAEKAVKEALPEAVDEADVLLAQAEGRWTAPPSTGEEWAAASARSAEARAMAGVPEELVVQEGTDFFAEAAEVSGGAGVAGRGGPTTLIDRAMLWSRMGAARSAARLADVGGYQGAFLRTIAGSGVGYALDGKRGAVEGALAMNAMGAKMSLRGQVRQAVSRFGKPAGLALRFLGPATGGLANRLLGGRDDEPDEAKLALARIAELSAMSTAAPDTLYGLVKGAMGVPGDLALKLHQQWNGMVQYLMSVAPKDPGINNSLGGSNWRPSAIATDKFAHQYEAILNPTGYIVRVMSGDGRPAGVEALAQAWPAMLQEAQAEVAARNWADLSLEETRGFSQLFRQPLSGLQHPSVVLAMQSQFIPRAEAGGGGGASPPTGNPTGRPPAVQSQVAGANVAGLIS